MCVHTVSHGVLWSRLCHRPGEEDQRKLPQRRLDRLHLSRGAQGKVDSGSEMHKQPFIYLFYRKKKKLLLCIVYPTTCWFGLLKKVIWFFDSSESQQRTDGWWKIHNVKLKKRSHRKYESMFLPFVLGDLCDEAREIYYIIFAENLSRTSQLSLNFIEHGRLNWTHPSALFFSY